MDIKEQERGELFFETLRCRVTTRQRTLNILASLSPEASTTLCSKLQQAQINKGKCLGLRGLCRISVLQWCIEGGIRRWKLETGIWSEPWNREWLGEWFWFDLDNFHRPRETRFTNQRTTHSFSWMGSTLVGRSEVEE